MSCMTWYSQKRIDEIARFPLRGRHLYSIYRRTGHTFFQPYADAALTPPMPSLILLASL
jgi:hypothetical protein